MWWSRPLLHVLTQVTLVALGFCLWCHFSGRVDTGDVGFFGLFFVLPFLGCDMPIVDVCR